MTRILLLIPIMLLIGACHYYSFFLIKGLDSDVKHYDLDGVKCVLYVALAIDCLLILRHNKHRQDKYRELIDSIGKDEGGEA